MADQDTVSIPLRFQYGTLRRHRPTTEVERLPSSSPSTSSEWCVLLALGQRCDASLTRANRCRPTGSTTACPLCKIKLSSEHLWRFRSFSHSLLFSSFWSVPNPHDGYSLLKHNREEDAKAVLAQLSVHEGADFEEKIEYEFATIKHALLEEEAATIKDKDGKPVSAVRACFTSGKERYFHRVMLGVGSQFMQQLCGINL